MNNRSNINILLCGITAAMAAFSAIGAPVAADATAPADAEHLNAVKAVKLAKSNRCMKCHSTFKNKKEGPSYPAIAARYKDDPVAEDKLIMHITSGTNIKLASGMEEHHKIIMNKSPEELRTLVKWILSK